MVQIERGGSPRPIDDFITDAPNGLNWVKIGDAPTQGNYITKTAEKIRPEGLSKTREVHPGDLILSNSMSFGKPYIMGIDGCIHDGWLLIRNTYGVFDLTFLCHLLGTPQMLSQYRSLAAGSTVNNLNKELVGNTVVTIPSITEQRVLGDYLERLDNLITLHQCKESAFSEWKDSGFLQKYKTTWEQRKAIDIADYSKGNGYSKGDLTDSGTPIILYGRLYTKYQFAISEVDTFAVPRNGAVYSQGNEVIVPASGETAEDIARASAVEKSGVLLGGDLNILRPFGFINPLFLALAISNGEPQKELAKKAQGKSVVHIHNTDIQEVMIAYPSRTEQERIVSVFRQLDNLITLHQCKESAFSEWKDSGFLQKYKTTWEQRKLKDVVDVCSGRDYKHLKEGNIPVYGTGGYMLSVDEALSYDKDAIGIGRKGTIDKPYILKAPFWTVDTLFYAIPSDDSELNFVYDIFQNIDWKKKDESTGVPSLSKIAINDIDVLVPCLKEQLEIGNYFRNLDHLITLHQRKPFCINRRQKWKQTTKMQNYSANIMQNGFQYIRKGR